MNLFTLITIVTFFSIRYGWSIFGGKRKITSVPFIIKFFRKFFELIVFLILPLGLIFEVIPSLQINNADILFFYIGSVLSIAGLIFMFFARFNRKKEWGFMADKPSQLIKTGVYSITRHPYYVGSIIFILGIYIQLNSIYILTILPGVLFLVFVIKKEEHELEKTFLDEWKIYKKKVGIFPFL